MGGLADILACYNSTDLSEVLAEVGESAPGKKPARVERIIELVAAGKIEFDLHILEPALKDTLVDMCVAVGLDASGPKDDLKRRLSRWYREHSKASRASPWSGVAKAFLEGVTLPQRAVARDAECPRAEESAPARDISTMSASELEFVEVTRPGVFSDLARGLGTLMGAPNVVRVPPAEAEKRFAFDGGYPREGVVYVRHPFGTGRYIPADEAAKRIAQEKRLAIMSIAGLLGATRVEVVHVEALATTRTAGADISVAAKQIGFDAHVGQQGVTGNQVCMTWPESRTGSIPLELRPYLAAVPELGALAGLVAAGRPPSLMHQDVHVDFRESIEIAARLSKISMFGSLAAQLSQQSFISTRWTLRIWFDAPAARAPAAVPAAPGTGAPTDSFCRRCGASRARQEDMFCPRCGSNFA